MCDFMGLTLLFRGLVRLWWHLELDVLKRVLILTMDILLNSLLSFIVLLCLAQGSFPILFANDKKTDSRGVFKLSPLIVDMDSIIDIHVQHVDAPVIHNVESWGALHDLLHLFNTLIVIHNVTPSICSEHDHRAIAAVFVHSDFKIDVHAAASDVLVLQRFTQHTLQIHTVMDFLSELTSHNPLGTWTQHFQSQQFVDRPDIQRQRAPLLWTDQVSFHQCPLAPHSPEHLKKKLSSTNLAILSNPSWLSCTFDRKTHNLLDPLWVSQNHHCTLEHHQQIQL